MKCHEEYKQLMSAYLDDELSPEEKDTVNNHLIDCPACQKYLKELQTLSLRIKTLNNEALSLDLEARLNNLNHTRTQEPAMQKTTFNNVVKVAVPLIIVGIFIFSFQMYAQRSIQGRTRDSAHYMITPQKLAMHGRLRSASDDIGDQYVKGHNYARITEKSVQKSSKSKAPSSQVGWTDTATTLRSEELVVGDARQRRASLKKEYEADSTKNSLQDNVFSPTTKMAGFLQYPYAPIQLQASNTEQYDLINENEFSLVTDNPLSTFSIDVDTASYSNVRRFLDSNQMPPRDAVRIEEMINYFQYNYPQPGWNQPFSITLEHGVCPWNPAHQLVLVGLQGKELTARQTPPSNLVFLIDVSGSMNEPAKLPLLKESLKMMVAQLRPEERVSMVVYAGNAGLVLDSAPGYNKGLIMAAIDNLQAGGSTAGGQGIQLAYDVAQKNFIHNGNNRVILATDGDFNVGVSSDSELVQIIEEKRKAGIFLTVLGFGSGNLQDAKMEKLADKGNGNYFYIDTLNEGKKVLVDELGSTLIAIAKDVKIQIEFNPKAVKAYRLIGYENRKLAKEDFNNDSKDAGELGAGHSVTALYEIIPAGSWESTGGNVDPLKYQKQTTQKSLWVSDKEMMTVKLRYKEPKSETSQLITKVLNQPANTFSQRWFGNSDNLQFASAVAEFGMLLRDSNFKAASSYQNVLQRAQNCSYNDPAGHKNEFITLVQKAAALDTRPTPVPVYQPQYQNYPIPMDEQGGYNQKGQ